MGRLELVHDVLDAQLVDHVKEKVGRIDSLLLELRDGEPPRIAAILMGGPVRAARIGRVMVWLSHAMRALGRVQRRGVTRVDWAAVREIGDTIRIEVEERTLESEYVERWLSRHVICRIPGASGEHK